MQDNQENEETRIDDVPQPVILDPKTLGLTPRETRFVNAYLEGKSPAACLKAANYPVKDKTAINRVFNRLIQDSRLVAAIEQGQKALMTFGIVNASNIIEELKCIGFSDIGEILDFSGDKPLLKDPATISEAARKSIACMKTRRYVEGSGQNKKEVEVTEFKMWDKVAGLEKLSRILGLFVEKGAGKTEDKPFKVYNGVDTDAV